MSEFSGHGATYSIHYSVFQVLKTVLGSQFLTANMCLLTEIRGMRTGKRLTKLGQLTRLKLQCSTRQKVERRVLNR